MGVYARDSGLLPLLSPARYARYRNTQRRFVQELQRQAKSNTDADIPITPSDRQLSTWKHKGTPIGATAIWYEFGNTPKVWKMRNLRGCTVTFIICKRGLWVCHLWESTKAYKINGGSAFLERISATKVRERDQDIFQKVAVDILTQHTPKRQRANRNFTSLADLKHHHGDPLGDGEGVDFLILTKAKSSQDPRPRYANKIAILRQRYRTVLPAGSYKELTYIGDGQSGYEHTDVKNVVSIQYTPYHAKDPGADHRRAIYAAAMIWVEVNPAPVIARVWSNRLYN